MEKGDIIIPISGMYKGKNVSFIRRGHSGLLGSIEKEGVVLIWPHEVSSRKERIKSKKKRRKRG